MRATGSGTLGRRAGPRSVGGRASPASTGNPDGHLGNASTGNPDGHLGNASTANIVGRGSTSPASPKNVTNHTEGNVTGHDQVQRSTLLRTLQPCPCGCSFWAATVRPFRRQKRCFTLANHAHVAWPCGATPSVPSHSERCHSG